MLTKRLEILLDPKDYKEIQKNAREKGESVGQLVRNILKDRIVAPKKKASIDALQRLFSKNIEIDIRSWAKEKKKIADMRIKEIEAH